jgi:hypothetical protein
MKEVKEVMKVVKKKMTSITITEEVDRECSVHNNDMEDMIASVILE